jgi:hypothetical protein
MKKKLIIISIILILLSVVAYPASWILSALAASFGLGMLSVTLLFHLAIQELDQMNEEAWKSYNE